MTDKFGDAILRLSSGSGAEGELGEWNQNDSPTEAKYIFCNPEI
jgi:hypothetical protein